MAAKRSAGQMNMGRMAASGQQHTRTPSVRKMDGSHSMVLGPPSSRHAHKNPKPRTTPARYTKSNKVVTNEWANIN